ncbi:hypothetical protein GO755_27720 [Spirosoma sp. HMF4905]|uniref:Lipoprotein n=1 Tax=Spirosoma arboris TaxID=2682092 RepID=A0A7K1SJU4_9BACT|nr:hypothetical protein [Spirosoma arboris]MVM33856.1 hypothetical protein [Spirosoma arboris]
MYSQILRRASLAALLLVGSLSACKQQATEVNPAPAPVSELSSRVSGQYTLKQVTANGQVYSADDADLKGGAKISRVSATSVNLDLDINTLSTNEAVMNGSVSGLTLTDAGNDEVNLVKGSDTIGKGSSNKLTLNVKGGDGVAYGLIMTK